MTACMTNLLCCRQHFKICSMQWEPNETWCHKKIYFPSNAIDLMKDSLWLACWVTALHILWSPAKLTLIRTGCRLTAGSIAIIDPAEGVRTHTRVCRRNPDCTMLACATGGKPKWILQVCIDWFHCKEQKYSRDSSWSVTSPNQIVTPPCKEMNGRLGGGLESWQTQGKVMWDLIRKPEIFG